MCFVAFLFFYLLNCHANVLLLRLATFLQVKIFAGCMSFVLLRFVVSPVRTCLNAISGSQLFFVCFVASLIFFCLCCNAYLLLLCLTTFLQVAIYAGCMSFWRLLFHVCFLFDCVHAICGPCFMFCAFVARFSYFFAK